MTEIYEKTMALFIAEGYEQVPLSRIAKALNITKAGLYHYFSTKEELLYFIHMHNLKKYFIPVLDMAEKVTDPQERITFFIQAFIRKSLTEDGSTRVLIHEVNRLNPEHQIKIREIWARGINILKNAISELHASGKIKNVNKVFASFAAVGMCTWIPYWFDYDRKESAVELAETYSKIFLHGLLKD
jgi:AcrR family transcriptional regulator